MVRATGPDPYIIFQPAAPTSPVSSIKLRIRPAPSMGRSAFFFVFFVPASAPPLEGFSESNVLVGQLSQTLPVWTVDWTLPQPSRAWRIDVPDGAEFQLEYLEVLGAQRMGAVAERSTWMFVLGAGAAVALLLIVYQLTRGPFPLADRSIRTVLIAALVAPLVVTTFLFPPFQGPDESAHWKIGLMFYRSTIEHEPAAYYLPDLLQTNGIPFHPEVKFPPARLRVETIPPEFNAAGMIATHQSLTTLYSYAHYISYPVLFVLSWLFPRVDSVQRALQLFYLARIVPAALMVALLYGLNRKYELPYTAWFFFSLPLVVQQFAIVTADTLLNAGAIIAVWLFLKSREQPSVRFAVPLVVLGVIVTYSKFIVAGVLLLPLLLVPYRRIPRRALIAGLGLALVLMIPAVYVFKELVLASLRTVGQLTSRAGEVDQQIRLFGTTAGLGKFADALTRYGRSAVTFETWSMPMGWLDVPLSPQHLSLIAASGYVAFMLDAWAYGPQIVRLIRTRLWEVALLMGVAVCGLAFAVVADGALFYLMNTPVGVGFINGLQVRHLFPAAIVALLLPLAVLAPSPVDGTPSRSAMVARTVAVVLLPLLLAARTIELAIDLLTRYW